MALPCQSSFAPHDPLLAGIGTRAPFKALKLELNSCSPVPSPSPQGFNRSGAQVEVGAGLRPGAALSPTPCFNSSFALTSSEMTLLLLLLGFAFQYWGEPNHLCDVVLEPSAGSNWIFGNISLELQSLRSVPTPSAFILAGGWKGGRMGLAPCGVASSMVVLRVGRPSWVGTQLPLTQTSWEQ